MEPIFGILVLGVVAILIILLVIRPIIKQSTTYPEGDTIINNYYGDKEETLNDIKFDNKLDQHRTYVKSLKSISDSYRDIIMIKFCKSYKDEDDIEEDGEKI